MFASTSVCTVVRVRVSSSLTCRAPRRILRTHPQYPVCHVCCCYKDVLASGFDGGRVFF